MFEALRWRLTAWYVLAFAVVFVLVGVVVFAWARHRLSVDVDIAVRDVSDSARREVAQETDIAGSEEGVRAILANASLGGSADVFVLLLAPDGSIAANPSDIPTDGLPAQASVDGARRTGADHRSYNIGDNDLSIRTLAVYDTRGGLRGFVQAGKSVEERDKSLRTLVVVMLGGGVAGLVLATVGGLGVARIALRPVRRSFDRQREFVADASHELRTPLAVIRVNSESLAAADPGDEAAEDIVTEASYMTRLLDDLLVLARSDREGIMLHVAPFDLAETARSAGRAAATLAASADLQLVVDVQSPIVVNGDRERCREVLLILLDNAIKYTPVGGIVTLRARAEGAAAVVDVIDTGIGIPPEHVARVFDRFYRVDKARSRAAGGAGLGLSIAREIVDSHKGKLEVDTEPTRGTTVTLRLPLVPASSQNAGFG